MKMLKNYKAIVRTVVIAVPTLLFSISNAQALDEAAQLKLGENEYLRSCAACHGANAKGAGPVAEVLSTKPSDLTKISKKFNGKFPTQHIYRVIDGRNMINPHGEKEMPIWGYRYMSEARELADSVPHNVDIRALAFGRIMSLVGYLESIQVK